MFYLLFGQELQRNVGAGGPREGRAFAAKLLQGL